LRRKVARKIERANVRQGFTLSAVEQLAKYRRKTSILSVGRYEDTALYGLRALGYAVVGMDPALDYDLATYSNLNANKVSIPDCLFDVSHRTRPR
jgi:hypothetical protein